MKTRNLVSAAAAGLFIVSLGLGACSSSSGLSSGTGAARVPGVVKDQEESRGRVAVKVRAGNRAWAASKG